MTCPNHDLNNSSNNPISTESAHPTCNHTDVLRIGPVEEEADHIVLRLEALEHVEGDPFHEGQPLAGCAVDHVDDVQVLSGVVHWLRQEGVQLGYGEQGPDKSFASPQIPLHLKEKITLVSTSQLKSHHFTLLSYMAWH